LDMEFGGEFGGKFVVLKLAAKSRKFNNQNKYQYKYKIKSVIAPS